MAAQTAVAMSVRRRERAHEASARHTLGDIEARREPPLQRESDRCYQEALAIAEELELRPLQAHCHLGLGKLHRRTGRSDEARAELATAISMLREMGMAYWLPEAEAELAQADAAASPEQGG